MKTTKWMPATAMTAVILLGASACSTDWGKMDPPAGVDVAPKLENVATYEFEDEKLDPMIFKTHGVTDDAVPALAEDERKGNVLSLPAGGWVVLHNPLNQVTCQKGASMTFWMKQIPSVDVAEDGTETVAPQDLASPLFSFTNESGNAHLNFSANGWLDYSAPDGEWSDNNPAGLATGYMPHGEWNYVALTVRNDGYDLYVNGEKKVVKNVDDFDCSKLVAFMNSVPNLTIGSADATQDWMIDDLKVYRNALTDKEVARPRLPGDNTGGDEGPDLSKWILVGLEDNTTGFWTEFSPYLSLTGDGEIHYEFYNYTDGLENWTNWLAVIATGERGCEGYLEYAVIRADNFGWGANWEQATLNCDFNFDTFKQDMQGAHVDLTIERFGETVTSTAIVTTTTGTVYTYKVTIPGITNPSITTWLLCERAHLLLNPEGCYIGTAYPDGLAVGNQDCSTGWWSAWTPLNKFNGDFDNFGVIFTNHTTGTGANWNNWLLVCTNGKWIGEDGYSEYFVLRSDAYGWGGTSYDAAGIVANFDWTTYVADMKDAKCCVYFSRFGENLTMVARQTTADGRKMPEYRYNGIIPDPDLGIFFTMELAWLEIHKVGYFPLISMSPEN